MPVLSRLQLEVTLALKAHEVFGQSRCCKVLTREEAIKIR